MSESAVYELRDMVQELYRRVAKLEKTVDYLMSITQTEGKPEENKTQ